VVTKVYTWWFDLPLYSLVPFITERLMLETDFENEAKNSEIMRELVEREPSLRGRVYVPPVYPELSSRRVLTTEWIEGVRLWDKDALTKPWLGGYGNGSAGVHGTQLESPDMEALRRELRENPDSQNLKPERTEWKGRRGGAGLGLSTKDVMTTMIDLFSAQIFKWGVVHCDPRMYYPPPFWLPQEPVIFMIVQPLDNILTVAQTQETSLSGGCPTESQSWCSLITDYMST
jgi:aarF domain-containing kinase